MGPTRATNAGCPRFRYLSNASRVFATTPLAPRARNPRTSRVLRRIALARSEDFVGVERDAEIREAVHHLADAIDAAQALLRQERVERSRRRIDEIAEDVHVRAVD